MSSYEIITSSVLPNGVYALENVGNVGLFMDIERDINIAGYHVQQYAYASSPAEIFSRAGLYKITKDTETDYYIIRSMLNNRMSFGFSGNEVITKYIHENDANVPLSDMFSIVKNGSGYQIYPYDSTYVVASKDNMESGLAGAPNSFLAKRDPSVAGNRGRWKMHRYTDVSRYGGGLRISPSATYGLEFGKEYSIMPYIWSTDLDENTAYLSLSSSYQDKADYFYDNAAHTMYLTPKKAGLLIFIFRIRKDGTTTTAHTLNAQQMMVLDIASNETYFIRNIGTGRYIDIEGPSTAEGAIIQQWQYNGKAQSKWYFEKAADGYFYIKSTFSNKYIGVDSSNTSIIRQYATKSNYTLWRFYSTSSGNYRLINKANTSVALAAPSTTSSDGADLVGTTYTGDLSYNDEWMVYNSKYAFNITHYYDQGYIVRYANSQQSANSRIEEYTRAVAEKMMRLYQLDISQKYEPFESSADDCAKRQYGSVIIETSPLSCNHLFYHVDRTAIKESVDDSGAHMFPIVAWTGHLLPNNPVHVTFMNDDSTASFVVITMYASVNNSYVQNPDAEVKAESEYALCHELSHCLSLYDHYCKQDFDPITGKCTNENCDECYLGYPKQRDCIMTDRGPYGDPTIEGYCLECYNRIRDFLSEND